MSKTHFPSFWSFNCFLLLAIALGVILRILELGSREFWYDEVLSLLLATGNKIFYESPGEGIILLNHYSSLLSLPAENSFADVLLTLNRVLKGLVVEPHPPLFFLGQHVWLRLFGNSEAAMRSLVMLFSLGAMGCAYGMGRRLLGQRGGLLFAALLGLNPFYLFHSLNVRMYGSLVFWVLLTGWAWVELLPPASPHSSINTRKVNQWHWWLILVVGTAAGLLTFYYFAVWILTLAIGVVLWDRQRWWRYAIAMLAGIALNLPWLVWGTRQQAKNADLDRFVQSNSFLDAIAKHGQELIQTLGTHLIIGDWASVSPNWLMVLGGLAAIAGLSMAVYLLWENQQRFLLAIGLLLGIFPLLLMLAVDFLKGQYTLGFGFGRSVIFVLPGCLLLLSAAIVKSNPRPQKAIATSLLILYLTINVADIGLRSRKVFGQIAEQIPTNIEQSTLIAINSPAWGHILRLAYYIPPSANIKLLARKSAQLPQSFALTLSDATYSKILWLDAVSPVWGEVSSDGQRQKIQQSLARHYTLERQQTLQGTWNLDNFILNIYQKSPL